MAKKPATKKVTKKRAAKKDVSAKSAKSDAPERRPRRERAFPPMPLADAIVIAEAIEKHASGKPMRRLTLFDHLGKSPDSGPSRSLITASSKYGLTEGGYQAEELKLTDLGRRVVGEAVTPKDRIRAKFQSGIESIAPFKAVHEKYVGNKLPSQSVMRDFLISDAGVTREQVSECIDTFIINAKDIGVLAEIAGAERLLSIDHVIDEIRDVSRPVDPLQAISITAAADVESATEVASVDWSKTCFYVTPIGDDGSELRKHSDLFLEHLVEPALSELGLTVIRADRVGKAGMITRRVLEYVIRSRLVVADLSFHNPNVFYELSLRHTCGLPAIQIIRARDKIPFDLKDFDTIPIDDSDIYTMIPKLEVYRSQIASQTRSVTQDDATSDNPILTYFPGIEVTLPGATA